MENEDREKYIDKERNDFIYSVEVKTLQNAINYTNSYWVWLEIQNNT